MADHHALHTRIRRRDCRRRRQRIVGLELDHRPDGKPRCRQRLFEQRELRIEIRLDARAGLVAGPELVPERLDDVVGGDADMARALVIIASTECSTPRTAATSWPSTSFADGIA